MGASPSVSVSECRERKESSERTIATIGNTSVQEGDVETLTLLPKRKGGVIYQD